MRALDLFCGGGGTAIGLLNAGFEEVVGVDIDPRCGKAYPGTFINADVAELPLSIDNFDFVWASPPCQTFSKANQTNKYKFLPVHCRMVEFTQDLLREHPYTAIENVIGAPIRRDLVLTGPMFGLDKIWRKRAFELSFFCLSEDPDKPKGSLAEGTLITVSCSGGMNIQGRQGRIKRGLPQVFRKAEMAEAMGLPLSMSKKQIGEAVPPAYAEFIGRRALAIMRRTATV